MQVVNNFNCRGFGHLFEDKLCLIFKLAPSVCRMTFPILASFFFFQAEDGIRDKLVTGVQTCALPISLGLSLEEAAWGIHQIVTTNMELATRVVSIERGRDPRALTLVAFGGSGPVHGCRLAQALGIPRVIMPAAAGVTAAIGLLAAEVRFDVARTYVRRLDAVDLAFVSAMYDDMTRQAAEVVRESAVDGH